MIAKTLNHLTKTIHVEYLIYSMISHFDLRSEPQFIQLHKNGFHTQKGEPTEKAA